MNGLKSWIGRSLALLGSLFSSHAWLTLFTLLVLMGLFMGLTKAGLRIAKSSLSTSATASKGGESRSWSITGDDNTKLDALTSGASDVNTCGQFLIAFRPDATISQISKTLQSADSFVVFGPNENLAFEVHVGSEKTKVAQKIFEESSAVASANPNPRCK